MEYKQKSDIYLIEKNLGKVYLVERTKERDTSKNSHYYSAIVIIERNPKNNDIEFKVIFHTTEGGWATANMVGEYRDWIFENYPKWQIKEIEFNEK
jgi:hypothetical protein